MNQPITRVFSKLRRRVRFWFCTVLMVVSTTVAMGQDKNVTLNFSGEPIQKVLESIQKQTGYRFLYNKDLIDLSTKVKVSAVNEPLKKGHSCKYP